MNNVGGTWWELSVAERWTALEDRDCVTLTHSANGAFQLSAAVKGGGSVLPTEVEEKCRAGAPSGATTSSYLAGPFRGFTAAYVEDSVHWQKFWLAHGNLMVFATYNGRPSAWLSERMAVHAMLATLRSRSVANVLPA